GGIERDNRAPRAGGRVENAVGHERRPFEVELRARTETVGLEPPGDLELAEVAGVDLIEGRIAPVRDVSAVAAPLVFLRARLPGDRRGRPEPEGNHWHQGHQAPN